MDAWTVLQNAGQIVVAIFFGAAILRSYQWVRSRSTALGLVLALGLLVRAAIGLTLFSISYLNLPIVPQLQAGGGFWRLAPDAKEYYGYAARSADAHTIEQDPTVPSPFFVKTLTLWMLLVGISPAAAILLNVCLYIVLVVAIIWCFDPVDDWRQDLPCIIGIAGCSFSPGLLIHTSQPLKDGLSCTLIALACLGVLGLSRTIYGASPFATRRNFAIGLSVLLLSVFGMAGIRWYYSLLMCATLAAVLIGMTVRGRTTPLASCMFQTIGIIAVLLLGFWAGAVSYSNLFDQDWAFKPSEILHLPQNARTGFLKTGGGTNIIAPVHEQPPAETQPTSPSSSKSATAGSLLEAEVARAIPVTPAEHAKAVLIGLGVVFAPMSLVLRLTGIHLPGGRGLLWIADLDTLFQDLTIISILILLVRRRRTIGVRLPLVTFSLTLAGASAVLLGYVVTNFGTLWRLRPLVLIPVLVTVVALRPRRPESGLNSHLRAT